MGCNASTVARSAGAPNVHESYLFAEKLGEGSFGQVRSCTHRESGQGVAVKILDAPDIRKHGLFKLHGDSASKRRADAEREGKIWQKLGCHRNVVRLMETFVDDQFTYFVMERCHRSLMDGLLKKRQLPATELLGKFCEMLMGIQHVHTCGVVHRDIKPDNFLIGLDGSVKLCDFGLSTVEPKGGMSGVVGTVPYMSPEMLKKDGCYTSKTDIWSFAATAYKLLFGRYVYEPFIANEAVAAATMRLAIVQNEPRPKFRPRRGRPEPPKELQHVVRQLLDRSPGRRRTASEALVLCQTKLSSMEVEEDLWLSKSANAELVASHQVCIASVAEGDKCEFKTRPDPTVAKGMDELLEQLQSRYKSKPVRAFSSPLGEKTMAASSSLSSSRMSKTSLRRVSSHCGEVSINICAEINEGLRGLAADDESTESTTASSTSLPSPRLPEDPDFEEVGENHQEQIKYQRPCEKTLKVAWAHAKV